MSDLSPSAFLSRHQIEHLAMPALAARAPKHSGPQPRYHGAPPEVRLLAATIDEFEHGVLLLDDEGRLLHVNHAARSQLNTAGHPLVFHDDELRVRQASDIGVLQEALDNALQRNRRGIIALGEGAARTTVSVVPLPADVASNQPAAVLLMLAKNRVCSELAAQSFARAFRLSPGETQVLRLLCEGASPSEIAKEHKVAISTVRTQITSIRNKTRTTSIRELVQQVAVLPPLMGVLRNSPTECGNLLS